MNKIKKSISVILIIFFIISISGCATYRMHPDFKERHKNIRYVSVMPPKVEIYKLTFKGDKEMMFELLDPAVQTSIEEIKKVFIDKGYTIQELDLSESMLRKDNELKEAVFSINTIFEKTLHDIAKRKRKKFTYELGPEVNIFADMSNADVLIFTREEGYKKTGGEITKDVLKSALIFTATLGAVLPIYPASYCLVQSIVVDANSGKVLWYNDNRTNTWGDLGKEPEIRNVIRRVLKGFPKIAKEAIDKPVEVFPLPGIIEEGAVSEPEQAKKELIEPTDVVAEEPLKEKPIKEEPIVEGEEMQAIEEIFKLEPIKPAEITKPVETTEETKIVEDLEKIPEVKVPSVSTITTKDIVDRAKLEASKKGIYVGDSAINVRKDNNIWIVSFRPRAVQVAGNKTVVSLEETEAGELTFVDIVKE